MPPTLTQCHHRFGYNSSDDATSTGGEHDRINQTFSFVNEGVDYHLSSDDEGARNHGISLTYDPYLQFFTDIDGDIRGEANPSTGEWDIGADEYIAL